LNPFKSHFDQKRDQMGIQQCSKKDVCLLMSELDMDFYNRAVAGELDGAGEVERRYLETGTCGAQARGVRMEELSQAECEQEARSKGLSFKVNHKADRVAGCYHFEASSGSSGIRFNTAQTSTGAGTEYLSRGKDAWSQTTKVTFSAVCDEIKRLLEDEAAYFSPYKMKEQMLENRAQYNTACSPGKMADLFRDRKSSSPCAEVLSFKAEAKYRQAQDAIDAGDMEYAQKLMEDNVLFDVITNRWCPDIWRSAQTCSISRSGKQDKMALTENACAAIDDELLADLTGGMDAAKPPDFYRDVKGVGSGESYTGISGYTGSFDR
jgi:hypothetical protein